MQLFYHFTVYSITFYEWPLFSWAQKLGLESWKFNIGPEPNSEVQASLLSSRFRNAAFHVLLPHSARPLISAAFLVLVLPWNYKALLELCWKFSYCSQISGNFHLLSKYVSFVSDHAVLLLRGAGSWWNVGCRFFNGLLDFDCWKYGVAFTIELWVWY